MRNAIRKSLVAAGFSAALALAGAPKAQGQVFFRGNFPVPHGRITVGIGAPFVVGGFVPEAYVNQIVYQPGYGYGFDCDDGWVSVRSSGGRWIVAQRPVRVFRNGRDDRRFDNRRSGRDDRRFEDRRLDRDSRRFERRDGNGRGDRDRRDGR